ncbi:hypothetical protein ACEZDB_00915 [Streptacidiphilus sp. N1-3]|uniref:Uncharacterized protein n=1 Tax=Streptacidiphilus alkalitolerans TaxID=3342712 RepID=A0ABV6WT64_9ACTN
MLWGIRVQGRERDAVVVWAGSEEAEQDRVLTVRGAGGRVLPVFRNEGQASRFLRGRGERLAARGPAFVGLAQVERWLKGPAERGIEAGWVLEAWNFLEDLARGLDAWQQLPAQGAVHNSLRQALRGRDRHLDPGGAGGGTRVADRRGDYVEQLCDCPCGSVAADGPLTSGAHRFSP